MSGCTGDRSLRTNKKHRSLMPDVKMDIEKLNQMYNEMLQPLTLFPVTVHSADQREDNVRTPVPKMHDTREEVDKANIGSFSSPMGDVSGMSTNPLCELVKRRLDKRSALNIGSTEVKKIFEDIILSEVKVISESIPQVLSSTLLNTAEKQQLHHRLISHILIVSEQLFVYYLEKTEQNKTPSVFSEEANLTRLKAQLLLDCSRFFNVFSVRHCLIAEIKGTKGNNLTHTESEDVLEDRTFQVPGRTHKKNTRSQSSHFTMGYFIKLGRPKLAIPKCQRDIDLLQIGSIQQLDLKKAQMLIPTKEIQNRLTKMIQCKDDAARTLCSGIEEQDLEEKSTGNKHTVFKKSASCPDLRIGDLLADELCINFKIYASECPEIQHRVETHISEGDIVSEDLKRLVKDTSLHNSYQGTDECYEEDIPPLICAVTHGVMDKSRCHRMEALLLDPDPNEQHEQTQKTETELHPQAYSVDVKIPRKPLMRRADVQTSDRIYTDFTDMQMYPPVYNDFSNEIEAASVARMDKNLYVGQELLEVYKELTQNISSDHLKFDQDAVMEPYATKVDFSKCISSSTLIRKKNQRVINKELDSLALRDKYDSSREQSVPFDKEASRICKSWLLWWKSIVNSDDYMKYLSTQDLDFLKVIYHLYDSDSEDEEAVNTALRERKEEQKRERDKQIAELRAEKQNYTPGMWNINSVMLGGLGTDPDLPDAEHDIKETLEFQKETSMNQELLQKRINAVWNTLHVPEGMRLDMAIKYSSTEYQSLLPKAIEMWEQAVKLIQKREEILAKLEMFERTASDPNRFFQKGHDGTSVARINESTIRKKFHAQLTKVEQEMPKVLQIIKKKFNDTVTLKGRPYAEKMQWDKVEMLYWLQQDRRKDLMERHFKKENAVLKLEPLS